MSVVSINLHDVKCRDCSICIGRHIGEKDERDRIIKLLIDLNAIRRDALGDLVAFNTDGTEVIYLPGLEENKK